MEKAGKNGATGHGCFWVSKVRLFVTIMYHSVPALSNSTDLSNKKKDPRFQTSNLWCKDFRFSPWCLSVPFSSLQLETKTGKAATALSATDALEPPDLKVALKREREEHQHLLADSYAAVMDLTKQVNVWVNTAFVKVRLEVTANCSNKSLKWPLFRWMLSISSHKDVLVIFWQCALHIRLVSSSSDVCPFSLSLRRDRPVDQSDSDRREELGQREAGAAGEVQPGESSVGAETERGHCTTGEGM